MRSRDCPACGGNHRFGHADDCPIEALEQQLAQAREETRRWIENAKRYAQDADDWRFRAEKGEQENRQARALLVQFAADDAEPLIGGPRGTDCILCDTRIDGEALQEFEDAQAHAQVSVFPHAPECAWLKARAYLTQQKENYNGQ